MLIRFIQRNQGHRDSMMHEFSSSVNKVNKAVAKIRTIGDRLPLRPFLFLVSVGLFVEVGFCTFRVFLECIS